MKKPIFWLIISSFISHAGFSDTYVWQDYDDFSGSSLDTSKWEIGYWDGAQAPNIENGKAHLYGTGVGVGSIVPPLFDELVGMPQNGTNQSFLVLKDDLIRGVEAEISLDSTFSGIYLGIMEAVEGGFAYAGTELNSWKQSGPSLEFSNTIYENGTETLELTLGDKPANLGQSYRVSIVKDESAYQLFLDSELIGEYPVRGELLFFNFGGYHDEDLPWDGYIDNVRVLRRAIATTLDGSILMLSSSDGVSETLAFENGTFTSTFTDPEEGSMATANQTYILDQKPDNSFKITLSDGDTYEFDLTTNSGTLVDYENGQIDTEGTWSFTFSRHDWEDYDDFGIDSLDANKWDISYYGGGKPPSVENGVVKLYGTSKANFNEFKIGSDFSTNYPNAENDLSASGPHSNVGISNATLEGIEFEVMMPSSVPSETGIGLYVLNTQELGNAVDSAARANATKAHLDLWYSSGGPQIGLGISAESTVYIPIEFNVYYRLGILFGSSTTSFFVNGEKKAEFTGTFSKDYLLLRGTNENDASFDTYLDNVRVLRRSHETTEPDPVTVLSDPNGQAVVVQVGEEYKWSSNLNGVTLWSVDQSGGDIQPITMRFENGRNFGDEGFYDSVALPQPYDMPFVIDENGYIKVTEESGYQYYHVVSVENGIIATLEGDEQGVVDDGVSVADQWFFTTRAAAEEFYYSKVNPKDWMWFDYYPWVYSNEEQGWLYFYPSGSKLLYWSNKGKAWRQFN